MAPKTSPEAHLRATTSSRLPRPHREEIDVFDHVFKTTMSSCTSSCRRR
jgi:hypothetical protein